MTTPEPDILTAEIGRVPQDAAERASIRRLAVEVADALDRARPPRREDLEAAGRVILDRLALPGEYLGFAMVAVNNGFWRGQFAAIATSRRLFLLPHCLRDEAACAGVTDSVGLHCAGCGGCDIFDLEGQAKRLGYGIIVAEGTSSVIMKVLEGEADAILGVACLDSLEKSFNRIVDLGIPNMAVPLLSDGCANTEAEMDEVLAMLYLRGEGGVSQTRTYLPLLREAVSFFEQDHLTALLAPHVAPDAWGAFDVPMLCTEAIGADWVKEGGKRLRPFVTSACYAVGKYGVDALAPDADLDVMVPQSVRRLSLSIEVMHKASLIHDDIMDDDAYRYGRETMHRVHGIGPAINLGDFLVGLGYKLIVGETGKLDAACIADIINAITTAHLALCRGQGAELSWTGRAETCSAVDALGMYALKTAPAFEVALYAGLRAANAFVDPGVLQRYSMYVGEGFQVLNDLEDWHSDEGNKVMRGQDALAGRPTILRAFTHEAGGADAIAAIMVSDEPADTRVGRMKAVYEQFGAFDKADKLLGRLRDRALTTASDIDPTPLRELFEFFVRMVLPARSGSKG